MAQVVVVAGESGKMFQVVKSCKNSSVSCSNPLNGFSSDRV